MDTIKALREQDIEYQGEIDHRMNELEIIWRQKEDESIKAKTQCLRYKQAKLDELGTCLFSTTQTLASKTKEFGVYFSC